VSVRDGVQRQPVDLRLRDHRREIRVVVVKVNVVLADKVADQPQLHVGDALAGAPEPGHGDRPVEHR
jgi:hypothetical protein